MNERVHRARHRQDNDTSVRLRCGKCARVLAEVFGTVDQPGTWADGQHTGVVVGYGRAYRWTCRCGSDHPVRAEKLTAAYRQVAALPAKRDRVVVLPDDLPRTVEV